MCIFCNIPPPRIVFENEFAVAIYDQYPVNKGHMLIIPKFHCSSYFDIPSLYTDAINRLLISCKKYLDSKYSPTGYNIGINIGESAGQTINHVHVHVIPRYDGDHPNPRGGARNIKEALVKYE